MADEGIKKIMAASALSAVTVTEPGRILGMEQPVRDTVAITILYVEDDHETRDMLLSMLAPKYPELHFTTADSGLRGLEEFRKKRPAIVITDISMPGMDGISMASGIKAIAPDTIIVAVTAHSDTNNLLRAIETGINHYILKPIDFERVCTVIDQSLVTVRKDQQLRDQYEQISMLNAALKARTQDLEHSNWELEAFNYTVAHDLRSPMVSITGFSKDLIDKCPSGLDERSVECLQVIYRETLRMDGLIDALLKFSRCTRKSIEKQWTDLSGIANEIRRNLMLRDPQRHVSFDVADDIKGFGDPTLLRIVLENLFDNAWKYSATNARACIEFGVATEDEDLVYFVRDNGEGFEQHEAVNLFAPFQRLTCDTECEGFGIGLATAYRIILRHGGKIWAVGEKGQGATFSFSL